ncbi:MAG: right-handed parallel beta-helix repeat-containing protein [Thermoplasmata archaeon]|nr:MAG: right-handed parallel beta-helix repeat-containing protein [Thermoplasmata archaeon]
MRNAAVSTLIIWVFICSLFTGILVFLPEDTAVCAVTITVDDDGPANYSTIQDAINAASDGDTVYVYNGTYNENIVVNRSISLIGESRNSTTIYGDGSDNVVYVESDRVNITGFTIFGNLAGFEKAGIRLEFVDYCRVFNNTIVNNWYGLYAFASSGNDIADNIFTNNWYGLYLVNSWTTWNNITDNNIYSSKDVGIYLTGATRINITGNNISYNLNDAIVLGGSQEINITDNVMIGNGINIYGFFSPIEHWNTHEIDISNTLNGKPVYYLKNQTGGAIPPGAGQVILANCTNITVENQNLSYGSVGVELGFSSNNHIVNNNITFNNRHGIHLHHSHGNNITGNNVTNNNHIAYAYSTRGISIMYSNANNLANNNVSNNDWGTYLYNSNDNNISYNDFSFNDIWGITLYESHRNSFTGDIACFSGEYGVRSIDAQDNTFINSTITNSVFYDFHFADNATLTAINTTFSKSNVYFDDTLSVFTVKWFLHVYLESTEGLPISGAEVEVTNITDDPANGSPFLTGSDGFVRWIVLTEYIQNDTNGGDFGGDNKVYSTPHNVTTTYNGITGYGEPEPTMDSSKLITIVMDIFKPIADAGLDDSVDEDDPYTFDGSGSTDNVDIANWTWDFGDGNRGYGVAPTHTYTSSGLYVVVLNVTDPTGSWDTDIVDIFVNNVPPTADAGDDRFGNEGEQLTFDGGGSYDAPSDISSLIYLWDFGDGNIGSGKMVNHTYEENGTYTVTLQVTDDDGAVDTDSITVMVNNTPPEIGPITPQFLVEDQPYMLQIIAADVKGDPLIFSDNTSMFDIDPVTGVISFTPENSDVGTYLVNITVTDDDGAQSYILVQFSIQNTNDAPVITSPPITVALEGSMYFYNVSVRDDDSDNLTFNLELKPEGMDIDTSGRITWKPTYQQASRTFMVIVNVSDGTEIITQMFDIVVTNLNDEPQINSQPETSAAEDAQYVYNVNASDLDIGDWLIYSLKTAPVGMNIDSLSGLISWVPTNDQTGYNTVIVNVTDPSGAYASQEFTIYVTDTNDAPVLGTMGPFEATEGETFSYMVPAVEIDADESLTFTDDTRLFDINSTTGNITFIPSNNDVGTYIVNITVSDSYGLSDFKSVLFTVNNVNDLPELEAIDPQTLTEDMPFTLIVEATDIDMGETLVFLDNSSLFDINPYSGEISFTPENEDVGIYLVNITVRDSSGSSASQVVTFTVSNVNDPPQIEPIDGLTVTVGRAFFYTVKATDADSEDVLTFSDDTEIFDIDPDTGEVSFTPEKKDAGVHYITITVADEDGETDQITVALNVVKEEEEKPFDYSWILLMIVVALVAFFFGYTFKRIFKEEQPKEKKGDSAPGEIEKAPPPSPAEEEEAFEFEAIDDDGIKGEEEEPEYDEAEAPQQDEPEEQE